MAIARALRDARMREHAGRVLDLRGTHVLDRTALRVLIDAAPGAG
jgi:hypothetical protein